MSIENNLERIAAALEALVALKSGADVTINHDQKIANLAVPKLKPASPVAEVSSTKPAPAQPDAPTTTVAVAAPVAEVPSGPAVPSLVVSSPEECNTLLVAEYNRLGGNDKGAMQTIINLMENRFKVRSVNDLSKDQYAPLILAVRELK